MQVLDPDLGEIWYENDIAPTLTAEMTRIMGSDSGGSYYVGVRYGKGSYTLALTIENQDDAGSGGDASDEPLYALEVEPGSYSGLIGDYDEVDWYTFAVGDGQVLSLSFTAGEDAEEMSVQVLDPDLGEIWYENDIAAGATETFSFDSEDLAATGESYYLGVRYGRGSYTVTFQ